MPIQTETIKQARVLVDEDAGVAQSSKSEVSLLDITILLVQHKRFVLRFVVLSALLATLIVFLLPVRYEGKVVLLPPHSQNSSVAASFLGQMGSSNALGSLGAIAGGLGMRPQSDMYVSLLKSRISGFHL